jgi:N5-(carboxyethyl)ornithine synthase
VVVNAILWDTSRKDHIIYREDLRRMKRNSLIIDISCDRAGGVETSIPTTIDNPIYQIDGVTHYAVDHTPTLFWKTTSECISCEFVKYVDCFIENRMNENIVLANCQNFNDGKILDKRIVDFQQR